MAMARTMASNGRAEGLKQFLALQGGHDVFLEHKRRYRLVEIEATLGDAGLKIVRGAYYFGLIFPLAAAVRLAI